MEKKSNIKSWKTMWFRVKWKQLKQVEPFKHRKIYYNKTGFELTKTFE